MKQLKDRILSDGRCFPGGILKVDGFINHQMDPNLMKSIAVEFSKRFDLKGVNKILTVEASGIAPAIMMGFLLDLPVVFAKKKKPSTMSNMLSASVFSFTKQRHTTFASVKNIFRKAIPLCLSTISWLMEMQQKALLNFASKLVRP